MIQNWDELLSAAKPLVEFLDRDTYFNLAYSGTVENCVIVTDAAVARNFATNNSCDDFDDWETISDSGYPPTFEWSRQIDYNLQKNRYFNLERKNFSRADEKWTITGVSCPLIELMLRDIGILLNCYANNFFPPIWKNILEVYLHNGFPCGWDGRHPAANGTRIGWNGSHPVGKMVVFSNH
jgi:hypothetical protein